MRIEPATTVKCIADFIGASKIIGDANRTITGLNELHEVEAGDITFVDHPKYYQRVLNSAATTIIINTADVPGESQGQRGLAGCRLWGRTELDTTEAT